MSQDTFHKCEVCGYVHRGAAPPETCPVCGVGPDQFVPLEVAAAPAMPPAARAWRCTVCNHVHLGDEPPDRCPVCGVGRELFEPEEEQGDADPQHERQVVILGAGIAGLTAAEHARETAPGADITLVSGEAGLPYYRLNLTRLLAGEVSEQSLVMRDQAWFEEREIKLVHGMATRILPRRGLVNLDSGQELPYDRLVLATGAHAFVPPVPGAELPGVLSFRTLEDARAIVQQRRDGGACVLVGGGLLGLETAGALRRQGMEVTVVEGAPTLLPRQLARPAALLLQQHLESLGIAVRCDVRVEELYGQQQVQGVRLAGGDELPGSLVVLSTGVRPNSHLARKCGLTVETGVVVDDQMVTTDPAILAAGDVAQHRGVLFGIWPTSFAQGRVAGINAAGGEAVFPGLPPSHKLKVLDVDLYSIGEIRPEDGSYSVHEHQHDGEYRRLVCRDGKLVGAVLYGDTCLAGDVRQAVESGVQIRQVAALAGLCVPQGSVVG